MGLSPKSNYEKKISFLVLTSGKFLEAEETGIGTGSIFCLSFSLSNRVTCYSQFVFGKYHTLDICTYKYQQCRNSKLNGYMYIIYLLLSYTFNLQTKNLLLNHSNFGLRYMISLGIYIYQLLIIPLLLELHSVSKCFQNQTKLLETFTFFYFLATSTNS